MGIFSFKKKISNSDSKWNDLVVTDLQKISHDSCVITLGMEKDKKTIFNFIPGQFLTIEVDVQGKAHRRSYSICSSPSDDLQIAVKKVSNGIVSTSLSNMGSCSGIAFDFLSKSSLIMSPFFIS